MGEALSLLPRPFPKESSSSSSLSLSLSRVAHIDQKVAC